MTNYIKNTLLLAILAAMFGCSSNAQQQRNLELLADNRAQLLSSELPLEVGPLSVMRASASGTTIELMMVYNQDQAGAKPTSAVLKHSINTYCTNPSIRGNLNAGLTYRIKIRNTRGQLMADELVSAQTCESN
ncbi:hypothetical protein NL53_10715 [Vibrio variabilis]|uniref:Uncharacterized protein n=1 Tax=Vibrio variabilis TaxID=990271 RepID=A0ABR4YAR0_9VIBR|nr:MULTISPECIES: GspS/AspS pilotin family protein [Vibrio]KHA60533.1 hypothetical protein NL53_10715 [Vibrio variabilis]KHT40345.1 hypothetical protein RJ47_15510 [Vibrio sinaloensis]